MNKHANKTLYNKKTVLNRLNKKETKTLFFLVQIVEIYLNKIKIWIYNNRTLLLLLAAILIFKISFLDMISTNGDPDSYWKSAKSLFNENIDYNFYHRSTRFSIIYTVSIFQYFFGTNPFVYYFPGLLFNVLQAILLYKFTYKFFDEKIAYFSTIFFFLIPLMFIPGYSYNMHIYPSPYSITFILGMFYFIFKYNDNKQKRYLIISSLFMFLAYGAKITNIFFFLPLLIIMRKNIKDYVIFGLFFLFLFIIETGLYNIFTEFKYGRLDVILNSHLSDANQSLSILSSPILLLRRLYDMHFSYLTMFIIFYLTSIWLLVKKDTRIKNIIVITYGFLIPMTFAVKSINPIQVMMPFNNRYNNIMLPFISIIIIYSISLLIKKFRPFNNIIIKTRTISFTLIGVSLLFFILNFSSGNILKIYNYHTIIDNAYKTGTPIVNDINNNSLKGLSVAKNIFIDSFDSISLKDSTIEKNNTTIQYINTSVQSDEKIKNILMQDKVVVIQQTPFQVKQVRFADFIKAKY